jgi:hypothetical protein
MSHLKMDSGAAFAECGDCFLSKRTRGQQARERSGGWGGVKRSEQGWRVVHTARPVRRIPHQLL